MFIFLNREFLLCANGLGFRDFPISINSQVHEQPAEFVAQEIRGKVTSRGSYRNTRKLGMLSRLRWLVRSENILRK
jgi:hypothetical protein